MATPEIFGRVAQSLLALGFSTIPFWGKTLFDDDLKYAYLLEPPYIYQVVVVSLVLVFSPQITLGLHRMWRAIASGAFFALYRARRGRFTPALVLGIACISVLAGGVMLIVSGWGYAFSAVREIKYHEGIYRGQLIVLANEQDKGPLIADALPTLERILELFPGEENGRIERWSGRVHTAIDLSETLEQRALAFASAGQYLRSVALIRASLDVWPENADAKRLLAEFDTSLALAVPSLQDLFARCANSNLPLESDRSAWKFLVGAPAEDADFSNASNDERNRLAAQLCSQPLGVANAEAFIAAIRNTALGTESPELEV